MLPRAILAAALAFSALCVTHAGEQQQITFVAWNVRNYALKPPPDSGAPTAKSPESVEAVVRTLAALKPDIVGLCEIGSRRDLSDLQRRLRRAGLPLQHSTWVDGADRHRHLALLSRFPLGRIDHDAKTAFPLGGQPRRIQRGILDAEVKAAPGFVLRILGVHLKSRREVPEFDQAEFRRAESLVLRRRVEQILSADPDLPLLVFGDFNDTKNSPVVRDVLGRRGSPVALTALNLPDRHGDQWTYHWLETDEYSRIDFVMVSNALRPLVNRRASRVHRDKSWRTASDHRPLVVALTIPAPHEKP